MIRIPQGNEVLKLDKDSKIHSLDQLVESLCESYAIPSSKVDEMKSGLEDALSTYLTEFLSKNSTKLEESVRIELSEGVDKILESIRFSTLVILCENGSEQVSFTNHPEGIEYQFLGFDASEVPAELLVETWNCKDAVEVRPLIEYILSRKES